MSNIKLFIMFVGVISYSYAGVCCVFFATF